MDRHGGQSRLAMTPRLMKGSPPLAQSLFQSPHDSIASMTDLLQHAFETVRRLPPEAQDHIAEAMLALAAEDAAPDRVLFQVSPEVYAAFLARLDELPQPNARLRKTMQTPAPWDAA